MIGLVLGWLFHAVIHGIIFGLGGFRSERLLLQYHDAIADRQVCDEATDV